MVCAVCCTGTHMVCAGWCLAALRFRKSFHRTTPSSSSDRLFEWCMTTYRLDGCVRLGDLDGYMCTSMQMCAPGLTDVTSYSNSSSLMDELCATIGLLAPYCMSCRYRTLIDSYGMM